LLCPCARFRRYANAILRARFAPDEALPASGRAEGPAIRTTARCGLGIVSRRLIPHIRRYTHVISAKRVTPYEAVETSVYAGSTTGCGLERGFGPGATVRAARKWVMQP